MFRLLLAPLYPVLVHLAVLKNSAVLAGAALMVLAGLSLYTPLVAGRATAWRALAGIALLLLAATMLGRTPWLLYLPPLVFPLLILGSFAVSLLPGRTPLVSAIAAHLHGPLSPELTRYTRAVTWLWALVIGGMLTTNFALSFGTSREAWSLFTNGGDYLLLVAVFLLEYLWRRVRFRQLEQPPFAEYMRRVLQTRPGQL